MAYFSYDGDKTPFTHYPFDFYSRFLGILPLESEYSLPKEMKFIVDPNDKNRFITLKQASPISLLWLMLYSSTKWDIPAIFRQKDEAQIEALETEAHYKLFMLALKRMEEKNPFSQADYAHYLRGECAAESIYFASVLLLTNIGIYKRYPIDSADIYKVTRRLLENGVLKTPNNTLLVRYFNNKIYNANRYIPSDDALWAREAVLNAEFKDAFYAMALEYIKASGVQYAQIAADVDDVNGLDNLIRLNDGYGYENYRLLVHTSSSSLDKQGFDGDVNRIRVLFKEKREKEKATTRLVGLDLLSMEHCRRFFDFLLDSSAPEKFAPLNAQTTVLHIHGDAGCGKADNNRSLCGYYFRNRIDQEKDDQFYKQLYRYLAKSHHNAQRFNALNSTTGIKQELPLSGLFDELFHYNSLTMESLRLLHFDITGPAGQGQIAYETKRNIASLIETLDKKPTSGAETYYAALTQKSVPFSICIGRACQARSFLSKKYPKIHFDTGLGSRPAVGAAGGCSSAQIYHLDQGVLHLDGLVDTNELQPVMNAVAYAEESAFSPLALQKIGAFTDAFNAMSEGEIEKGIREYINTYQYDTGIMLCLVPAMKDILKEIKKLDDKIPSCGRKGIFLAAFALLHNWRSLILGAYGQGVAHTDIQKESARMALLQTYSILHAEVPGLVEALLPKVSQLIAAAASASWERSIGKINHREQRSNLALVKFEGVRAPESIVYIKTESGKQ
ncbi:hypothetical protein [Leminorella grimontii]|uniref:hypothetical protein n=1 Tax=Leminorella grimontii TaxID=82981 RepID=UPI00208D83E7|nr:hypothetical protein [Leminorella grimontii]GKX59724.1 hypothetical protein SOASR031_20390 [Leminorella grimontii]